MVLWVEPALHGRSWNSPSAELFGWDSELPDVTLTFSFEAGGDDNCPLTQTLPIAGDGSIDTITDDTERDEARIGTSSWEWVGIAGSLYWLENDVIDFPIAPIAVESPYWAMPVFPDWHAIDLENQMMATADAVLGPWEDWGRD